MDGGTTEGAGDVMLRLMGAVNRTGKLILGRSGNSDIRSHAIEVNNNSGGANNFMKFLVHDGGSSSPYETRTEVMTLLGDGNVGIGTTSPGIVLDVGSSLSNPQIGRNYATGSVHDADKRDAIYFGRWDGTGRDFLGIKCRVDTHTALGYGDYSNQTKLEFHTWGNNYASSREVMCIRGDGNVGIGTTNPNTMVCIDGGTGVSSGGGVLGIRQKGNTMDDGITLTSSHSNSTRMYKDASGHFHLYNTGGGQFTLQNGNGNVGIGTSSPKAVTHVGKLSANSGTFNDIPQSNMGISATFPDSTRLWLANRVSATGEDYWGMALGTKYTGDIYIQSVNKNSTAVYDLLLQPNGGNVGIGTTSPGYKLHVNGSSMFTSGMNLTTSSGYAAFEMGGPSGAYIDLKKPASDDYDLRLITTGTGGSIQVGGVGGVMNFDGSGNVGIGTTSPGVKLDVNGTIKATSYSNTQLAFKSYTITGRSSATMTLGAESVALTQSVTIPDEIDISTPFSMQFTWYWLGEISGPSQGENFMFDIKVTPSGGSTTRLGQSQVGNRGYGITTHAVNFSNEEASTPDTATITGTVTYNSLSTRTLSVQLIGIQEYSGNATLYTNRTVLDSNASYFERGITTLACIFYK